MQPGVVKSDRQADVRGYPVRKGLRCVASRAKSDGSKLKLEWPISMYAGRYPGYGK